MNDLTEADAIGRGKRAAGQAWAMFRRYWPYLLVALISLGAAVILQGAAAKAIATVPFSGALIAGLFQLARDEAARSHEIAQQERAHAYATAATSHMSIVVFDKHVQFCEEYMEALQGLLGHMFAEGDTSKAQAELAPLYEVRRRYRLWISAAMAAQLDDFESKVSSMASARNVHESKLKAGTMQPGDEQFLQRAFVLLGELLNLKDPSKSESPDSGYILVISHLQRIMGVDALTTLRIKVLEDATGT